MEHRSAPNPFESLARLALGGLLIVREEMERHIEIWSEETVRMHQKRQKATGQPDTGSEKAPADSPPHIEPPDSPGDNVRYALLGLMTEWRQNLLSLRQPARSQPGPLDTMAASLLRSWEENPALAPARQQFDALVARGERELDRWITVGKEEERYNRAYAWTALRASAEESIHTVVHNPEVHTFVQDQTEGLTDAVSDIIQEQSFSMADEVVDHMRGHTVSIDNRLEEFFRKLFRRVPRKELPPPPDAVRRHAAYLPAHDE